MNYFDKMCITTRYEPITTFWSDFTHADHKGEKAIEDLYKQIFDIYKDNVKYFTEFVMVLNWKCWYHHDVENNDYSLLYEELFYKAQTYGYDHFKNEDLTYFWRTLD